MNVVNGKDGHKLISKAECHSALRLHRISGIDPGLKAAKEGCDFWITILQQEERRTGARVFVQSGTVGDDPLLFIQTHAGRVCLNIDQGNGQRAGNVAGLKRLDAAHIHDNRFTALHGSIRILH